MLHLEKLSLMRGGQKVVHDVSGKLQSGRVLAIIGDNGAGKSTLLDGCAGLVGPVSGKVSIDGHDLLSLSAQDRARRIASLSQQPVGKSGLSVQTRIGHGLVPRRGPDALLDTTSIERIHHAATQVGIATLLHRPLAALSGGERRRVEVARVLVDEDTDVVLVDEPFAGVDVRHQPLVIDALRARAAGGAAVVITLHQLDVLLRLADDVLALVNGRVTAWGCLDDILTTELLHEVFGFRGRLVRNEDDRGVLFTTPAR